MTTSFAELITILRRIESRQDSMTSAISTLADAVENQTTMIEELNDWLREPPSSALPDALAAINAKLDDIQAAIARLGGRQ